MNIPKTMKAYMAKEYGGPLVYDDFPVPTPQDHEVLAKTLICGLCHTDIHSVKGDLGSDPKYLPIIPGHEGVGIVVAVGPKVSKLKVNDRVGVPWLWSACMKCYLCDQGKYNLCEKQLNAGFSAKGCFAEYFVAHEEFAAKIPQTLSTEMASTILCAGLTTYAALKQCQLKTGATLVVSGACGGLGLMALRFAKLLGYKTIALDILDASREKLVLETGAQYAVNVKDFPNVESLADHMQKLDPSAPILGAVIVAPLLSAASDAVEYIAPGGTIICIALPTGNYEIPCAKLVLKGVMLKGSIVGTPEELKEALELTAKGDIHPTAQVRSHTDAPKAMAEMEQGKLTGRVLLQFAAS